MRKLASIAVFLISLAVCIAILVASSDLLQRDIPEETMPSEERNESVSGNVADIVTIEASAVTKDWDEDGKPDGFTLYVAFFDCNGNRIEFDDTEYTIRMKIFAADVESNQNIAKGELLYDFCCPPIRKRSSHEVGMQQGVEVYINLSDSNWIIIEVEVEIPGVGVFHAEKEVPCHL